MNVQGIFGFFLNYFVEFWKKKIQEMESFGKTIANIPLGSISTESRLSW